MDDLDDIAPATGEWECMECGHVLRGVEARPPRECPECGAPARALEFFSDVFAEGDMPGEDTPDGEEDDLDEDADF